MFTYKGYAFIKDDVVTSIHYYELDTDTIALDGHPQVVAIPEDKLTTVVVGWQYVDGEFTQ